MSDEFKIKDSGERQKFSSGMVRDVTTGKMLWHLVASGPMLRRWAQHLTSGADKYNEDNWMLASSEEEHKRFKASAFRHFMQWWLGERDEDHGAAVIFNINGAEYVKERLDKKLEEEKNAGTGGVSVLCAHVRTHGTRSGWGEAFIRSIIVEIRRAERFANSGGPLGAAPRLQEVQTADAAQCGCVEDRGASERRGTGSKIIDLASSSTSRLG